MWRWIVRAYVAFVVFVFLQFVCGVGLLELNHFLIRYGYFRLNSLMHEYTLTVMFLLGLVAGMAYLGSNFTGQGWFRSKSGLTYEGFRLEAFKRWTWLIASPILIVGIFFWVAIQKENGVLAQINWLGFYRGFLMPECSNRKSLGIGSDLQCELHLMFLGMWVAAVGYSFAPIVRKQVLRVLKQLRKRRGPSVEMKLKAR
jgi:hypothetical protein